MSPDVIAFVGKVGAGKSTQIRHLASYFKKRGVKCKHIHLKTFFPLTGLFSKILTTFKVESNISSRVIRLLVAIDLGLNAIILPIKSLYKIRFSSYFTDVMLIEEYLPGILVDYYHLMKVYNLNKRYVTKLMHLLYRSLFIDNLTTVILYCSYYELRYRWKKRGSPDEHAIYLRMQEIVYNAWSRIMNKVILINVENKAIDEVKKEILNALKFLSA
jgi:deoxyadenosine/deoxycytidine kinase